MKNISNKNVKLISNILLTRKGEINSKFYGILNDFFNCEKVRVWDAGNISRPARVKQYINELAQVVELCGYSVISDNDAQRGGRNGDYLQKTGNKVAFNEEVFFNLIKKG